MGDKLAKIESGALVSPERRLEAIRQIASQATPKDEIRWRDDGGRKFPYTDPAYVIRTLNEAFGWDWDFDVDHEELFYHNDQPFEIKCRGKLTVRLGGQSVTKTQYGAAQIRMKKDGSGPVTIGDMYKGAASDALKKCAAMLGIALDLYDSDSDIREGNGGNRSQNDDEQFDPKPKVLADLVTPKQLWMIRSLGREAGIDADQECAALFEIGLEEISKRAASKLIDHLKSKAASEPNGELDAIRVENDPGEDSSVFDTEPVEEKPTVKRTPRPNGKIGQILALQDYLKWDDAALRKAIFETLQIAVATEIIPALESLSAGELQQIIQLLEGERQARMKAQGGKQR